MTSKLKFLLLGMLLVLGLAACGNDKEDQQADTSKEDNAVTGETESTDEADDSDKAETNASLLNDKTIGFSLDEFKERFNKNAKNNNLDMAIGDYEWKEYDETSELVTVEVYEDMDFNAMRVKDEEHVKMVHLEIDGAESRETAYALIQTMIESVDNEMTEADAKSIMAELKLDDVTVDGDGSERYYSKNGLIYLLMDDPDNWIEFGIANENDPDLDLE